MIYILAPFNLTINTTSRNRILSFYTEIKRQGLEVTVINPPMPKKDRETFLNGLISEINYLNNDFVHLELNQNFFERLAALLIPDPKHKLLSSLLNLTYLVLKQSDFHYPVNSLLTFFKHKKLGAEDILIASGSPFSLFKAATFLSSRYKCKVVLDYRDPWTYGYDPIDAHPVVSKLKRMISQPIEKHCLTAATLVSCDSESVKRLFPKKFQGKITVILNGANLKAIDSDRIIEHFPVFRIVYLGTIYNDQLVDETFFLAAKKLADKFNLTPEKFEIIFVGSEKNVNLRTIIAKHGLEIYTRITRRLEIQQAMEIAYTASVFLHLKYGDRIDVDTSKQLDYLALQKPILLPSSDNGNVVKSILSNKAGYVCHSVDECILALESLLKRHKNGASFKIDRSKRFLYNISREAEAEKLVESIKKYCLE